MFYYLHKSRAIILVPSISYKCMLTTHPHFFYINSLLAMLNSRSEHHSTKKATESEVNSLDAGIAPHSPESDISETNISIPLPDISSVNNKLGPSREDLDSRV
ncbi:uncharacterized protein ARMOST_18823 [Armillaria ostoyae]|uniref:Uncharacterized protein n=1 Tax=Armillaria ostoyae TaxID=47428 RepID=A0A284S2U1_ARMOS|nr:uncharacterized protein ARMOST_18823 [Armillaria ostoyae]